jgi:hypothetical protein
MFDEAKKELKNISNILFFLDLTNSSKKSDSLYFTQNYCVTKNDKNLIICCNNNDIPNVSCGCNVEYILCPTKAKELDTLKMKQPKFIARKLYGNIKVVDSFPNYTVKVVDSFPDLNVKVVDSFPDAIGKWKYVDSFPDFTIKFVDSFPDIQVKFVDSFPGIP